MLIENKYQWILKLLPLLKVWLNTAAALLTKLQWATLVCRNQNLNFKNLYFNSNIFLVEVELTINFFNSFLLQLSLYSNEPRVDFK